MTQRDRELRAVTVLDLMMLIADFAFVLHQNSAVHQSASYHLARGDGVFRSLLGSRLVRWVWAIVVGLVFAMAGCWAHDEFVFAARAEPTHASRRTRHVARVPSSIHRSIGPRVGRYELPTLDKRLRYATQDPKKRVILLSGGITGQRGTGVECVKRA